VVRVVISLCILTIVAAAESAAILANVAAKASIGVTCGGGSVGIHRVRECRILRIRPFGFGEFGIFFDGKK
jgi:hypothetical protein